MTQSIWPESQKTDQLLLAAQTGDRDAIDQLLERHRESLRRMVGMRLDQRVQQRIDVSDVVQEVIIEANRRLRGYLDSPIMPFHLWIRQIAKDRIIDAHRRHRVSAKRSVDREQPIAPKKDMEASTLQLAAQLQDPELTPAAAATARELAIHVHAAIEKLDGTSRDIILMRHFEQLSNQEIAAALDVTEPAASMRYLRAIKRLRKLLEGDETLLEGDETEPSQRSSELPGQGTDADAGQ